MGKIKTKKTNKDYSLGISIGIILLLIVLPITVASLQHQQDTKEFAATTSMQPTGPTGTWNLVWNDEFNDAAGMSGPTNGLTASKWNSGWQIGPNSPGTGNTKGVSQPVNTSEAAYYGPASILFPGENELDIRVQKGIDSSGTFGGRSLETGYITTAGLMALNPANITVPSALQPYTINGTTVLEIRARIPGPNADAGENWPVWWLTNAGNYGSGGNPSGSTWPGGTTYSEEIDLAEWYETGSLGNHGIFHLHSATEYGGMSSIPSSLQNTDMSLAYHTYTYEFTANSIQIWVDGMPVSGVDPTAAQLEAEWKYPQYLMIGFSTYPGVDNPTSATGQPNDLMVNYVRVWQQCSTSCSPTVVLPSSENPTPTDLTPTENCLGSCATPVVSPTMVQVSPTPTLSSVPSSAPTTSASPTTTMAPISTPGNNSGNIYQQLLLIILQLLAILSKIFGHH